MFEVNYELKAKKDDWAISPLILW